MSRRELGIGAFVMILLIIGIVVVSRHPAGPSLPAPIESGDSPAKPNSAHAAAPAAPRGSTLPGADRIGCLTSQAELRACSCSGGTDQGTSRRVGAAAGESCGAQPSTGELCTLEKIRRQREAD